MDRLEIIDSTTITLYSNLTFKGVGRHPKTGKKDAKYQTDHGLMDVREQHVTFSKQLEGGGTITNNVRIMGYTYSQSVIDGDVETIKTVMELLGDGYNDTNALMYYVYFYSLGNNPEKIGET